MEIQSIPMYLSPKRRQQYRKKTRKPHKKRNKRSGKWGKIK